MAFVIAYAYGHGWVYPASSVQRGNYQQLTMSDRWLTVPTKHTGWGRQNQTSKRMENDLVADEKARRNRNGGKKKNRGSALSFGFAQPIRIYTQKLADDFASIYVKENLRCANCSPQVFGGSGEIRTHVPLRTTAFRVRLVTTTSIHFHNIVYCQ